MRTQHLNTLLPTLLAISIAACGGSDDATDNNDAAIIEEGTQVTLRNTLQDPGQSEVAYAQLFGQDEAAFDETGTVSYATSEFETALAQQGVTFMGMTIDVSGLYDIDMDEDSISFTLLPSAQDPFWSNVFGVFPEGKLDRYYLTFSQPHNIKGFTSDNESINLRIDSDTVVVVEVGAGYDMAPGAAFTIELQ